MFQVVIKHKKIGYLPKVEKKPFSLTIGHVVYMLQLMSSALSGLMFLKNKKTYHEKRKHQYTT